MKKAFAFVAVMILSCAGLSVVRAAGLTASDGAGSDYFGFSVSISGNYGLVGAYGADIGSNTNQGAAYLFRNLDTATGNVTENAKLTASDGAGSDYFGFSVSISGNYGLVGADFADIGSNTGQGAAYLFRDLDTASGNVTEHAKLTASDGLGFDGFGWSVSISGNFGLVGAAYAGIGSNTNQGAAYLFRDLDTASGPVTEHAKLNASDGAAFDNFGTSVSISGNYGLVGAAYADIGGNDDQGAAYLFRNLDTATGNVTENVKLIASDGAAGDSFGYSVSLDGDRFIVGAYGKNSLQGKAYSGHVRTFLTADLGNDATATDGLSFISREDWIIGTATSNNTVTLSSGDSGNVTATGKGVYIGDTWSGENTLHVSQNATLNANHIQVGKADGLGDNELKANGSIFLSSGGNVTVQANNILSGNGTISGGDVMIKGSLRPGNSIGMLTVSGGNVTWEDNNDWIFELGTASPTLLAASTSNTTQDLLMITGGDFLKGSGSSFTFDFAGTGSLGWYKLVDWDGTTDFTSSDFSGTNLAGGYSANFTVDAGTSALYVQVVPEPSTAALLLAGAAAGLAWRRRGLSGSRRA